MFIKSLILLACFFLSSFSILTAKQPKDKIALLFLTRQDLNHPKLWQELLEEATGKYTIYFHSKEELVEPFFKPFRIHKIVPTSWSIHVRAWQVLIQEALRDTSNQWFAFLSESCIPLYSLNHIYKHIKKDGNSHVCHAGPWWPQDSPREIHELYPEYRLGNWEWIVLSRKHAEIVAKDRALIGIIAKHPNDQESYFGCLFAVYGCLHEICNHTYTYANWRYSENNGCHPHCFKEVNELNASLLEEAYADGHLFARKFAKEYPQSELLHMIRKHSK